MSGVSWRRILLALAVCLLVGVAVVGVLLPYESFRVGPNWNEFSRQGSRLELPAARHLLGVERRPPGARWQLVEAWAPWCGPCQPRLAALEEFAHSESAQRIEIVVYASLLEGPPRSRSRQEELAELERSFTKRAPSLPLRVVTYPEFETLGLSYPAAVLLDSEGRIVLEARSGQLPLFLARTARLVAESG